jgi:hypothetical protein
LARLRPDPTHLTSFYLLISIGGALGGLFVNLAAPMLFISYQELPLGLALCIALYLVLIVFMRRGQKWIKTALLALVVTAVLVGTTYLMAKSDREEQVNSVWLARNFYGVLKVKQTVLGDKNEPAFELVHGIVLHGLQFTVPDKRSLPTTYYWEGSGVGLAFLHYPNRNSGIKVGVLGLGTGTLAAYGHAGDTIRFYEINPLVVRLAKGEGGYFTFLKDSPASVEIAFGDARLSLELELAQSGSQGFDLLVLDTFNSDSIPVHLLTRQAFALYLQHLKPDGVLAVHVSNLHLDIEKVVYRLAQEFGLPAVLISRGAGEPGTSPSSWVLLTTNQDFLNDPDIHDHIVALDPADQKTRLWTDDYSNLLQILH